MERVHRFVQNGVLFVVVFMHSISFREDTLAFSQVGSIYTSADGLEDYEKYAILHILERLGIHFATIGVVAMESRGGIRYCWTRSMSSWRECTPSFV